MAGFLFKLETLEGEPAEPRELSSAVPNWAPGHEIHFGNKDIARRWRSRRRCRLASGTDRGGAELAEARALSPNSLRESAESPPGRTARASTE